MITNKLSTVGRKKTRKEDARALAELLYDIYKEKKRRDRDTIVSVKTSVNQDENQ